MSNTINGNYISTPSVGYNSNRAIQSSKEENNNTPKEEQNVAVEISEEGRIKLKENELNNEQAEWKKRLEDQHIENQKQWEESGAVKQNVGRRIIPNIQLNSELSNSLKGSNDNVIDAAHSIINDNLLNADKTFSEDERKELIAIGIEKAKYLSENYMDKDKAKEFMSAMYTIAKIGANGKADNDGTIKYDMPKGPLQGAPDDNINEFDVMEKRDPNAWNTYNSMMSNAINSGDKEQMVSAMKYALDWSKKMHKNSPKVFEDEIESYKNWKDKVNNTKISESFISTNKSDKENFVASVNELNSMIEKEKLNSNLKGFFEQLERIR